MRLPRKTGFSTGLIYSLRDRANDRHYVELWSQPLHRWILARIYHHYDMHVFRLPGFELLERWVEWRSGDALHYLPISARQDLRCYRLGEKDRTVLAHLDIEPEVAEKIDKRT
jgi:hypothetical protein